MGNRKGYSHPQGQWYIKNLQKDGKLHHKVGVQMTQNGIKLQLVLLGERRVNGIKLQLVLLREVVNGTKHLLEVLEVVHRKY